VHDKKNEKQVYKTEEEGTDITVVLRHAFRTTSSRRGSDDQHETAESIYNAMLAYIAPTQKIILNGVQNLTTSTCKFSSEKNLSLVSRLARNCGGVGGGSPKIKPRYLPGTTNTISPSRHQSTMSPSKVGNGTYAAVDEDAAIKAANDHAATHQKINAWQSPGPAAFDFRSDTHTTPTAKMLDAITHTTLMDDVFLEDRTTNDLESYIAQLTGHESALLVMSGTMGNQVALRTHLTQPPHSVLCDVRGHINNYEAGGVSVLSQAMLIPIRPSNNHHLTLEDIQSAAIISDDIHACPTRVISLENTLDGMVMPLSEAKRIATFAREHNIKLHLDGARIWEVVASNAGSLPEYCSSFDSVSLCFSKGLGAPIGSIIVGSKPFITHARRIRKMIGGGTRQAGVISAAARVAVDDGFGHGPHGEGGKLRASHANARKVAEMWKSKGGKLANPTETNMVWLDLAEAGCPDSRFAELAAEEGLKARGGRLVVHYQITQEAIERLGRIMNQVLKDNSERNGEVKGDKKRQSMYDNGDVNGEHPEQQDTEGRGKRRRQ
jgi:threonine aldolase